MLSVHGLKTPLSDCKSGPCVLNDRRPQVSLDVSQINPGTQVSIQILLNAFSSTGMTREKASKGSHRVVSISKVH